MMTTKHTPHSKSFSIILFLGAFACSSPWLACGDSDTQTENKPETNKIDKAETQEPATPPKKDPVPEKEQSYVPPPLGTEQDDLAHSQHIIIAFKGTKMAALADRSQAEAKTLATEVLALAKTTDDFTALVLKYSDDPARGDNKGRTVIANFKLPAQEVKANKAIPRQAVRGVGDVLFKLKVGEVGLVPYDELKSPVGYWIIKRTK